MGRVFFFFFSIHDIFLAQGLPRIGEVEKSEDWRKDIVGISRFRDRIGYRPYPGVEIYTKIQWPSVRSVSHAHALSYGRARWFTSSEYK